jgi:hypothetical protein
VNGRGSHPVESAVGLLAEFNGSPSRGRSITPPVVEHQVIVVSSDDEKLVGGASPRPGPSRANKEEISKPPKPFVCSCGKDYTRKYSLVAHQKSVREKDRPIEMCWQ